MSNRQLPLTHSYSAASAGPTLLIVLCADLAASLAQTVMEDIIIELQSGVQSLPRGRLAFITACADMPVNLLTSELEHIQAETNDAGQSTHALILSCQAQPKLSPLELLTATCAADFTSAKMIKISDDNIANVIRRNIQKQCTALRMMQKPYKDDVAFMREMEEMAA
jgi:hypothetical protein